MICERVPRTSPKSSPNHDCRRLIAKSLSKVTQHQHEKGMRQEQWDRTELISAAKGWGAVVYATRQCFKETNRDISILEREGFTEISACGVYTCGIRTKVAECNVGWVLKL